MRYLSILLFGLLLNTKTFGTAQIPDLLIYNGDTLSLFSNPLEDYYNEKNPRPQLIVGSGCMSTACWRGYQAIWKIENNILYLVTIQSCCFWNKYKLSNSALDSLAKVIPGEIANKMKVNQGGKLIVEPGEFNEYGFDNYLKKKLGKSDFKKYEKIIKRHMTLVPQVANLAELFGEKCIDGIVKADWFSGMLRVPKGEMLNYVHMGYMSTYEYELLFELENGNVIETREFSNVGKTLQLPSDYGILMATSYSLAVPKSFLDDEEYLYTTSDTIKHESSDETMMLDAISISNIKRMNPAMRKAQVELTIDSLTKNNSFFKFELPASDLSRWGTVRWVDGYNPDAKEFIRIYTLVNINSQMILFFRSKSTYESFFSIAQNITQTVRLMEFGY